MSEGAQAAPLHLEGVISTKRFYQLSSRLSEAHGEISYLVISTERSAWRDLSTTLEMTDGALEMTDGARDDKGALEMTK